MKSLNKIFSGITTLILIGGFYPHLFAQPDKRIWVNLGLQYRAEKNTTLALGLLNGYHENLQLSFKQYSISLQHKLTPEVPIRTYFMQTLNKSGERFQIRNRYGIGTSLNIWENDLLNLSWRSQVEYHTADEKKFRYRFITGFQMRSKNIRIADQLRLNIFTGVIGNYNIGGEPISQYTGEGQYIGEYSPLGFHRLRWNTGFSLRWNNIILSTGTLIQREFNIAPFYRNINTRDIKTNKIKHAFDQQNILTFSLTYIIRSEENDHSILPGDDPGR